MTTPNNGGAASQLSRYTSAMVRGDFDTCIRIEQQFDLYGYPPEIVCIGLKAVDEGRDHYAAVDAYIAGAES